MAIDAPTGLCADTGRRLGGGAANAAITYCIGLIKQGLVQDPALALVGRLERIDLALPASLLQSLPLEQPLGLGNPACVRADQLSAPWPRLDPAAGKYARGRLLVVAGSRAYRGAATWPSAAPPPQAAAVCGPPCPWSWRIRSGRSIPMSCWRRAWEPPPPVDWPWPTCPPAGWSGWTRCCWALASAWTVLGAGDLASGWIPAAEVERWRQLQEFPGLLVLDADGLNRLAAGVGEEEDDGSGDAGGEALAEGLASQWLQRRGGPTWITPHQGEFARLFPDLASLPPLEAAAAAARRCGVSVLLKGARSVVASPEGRRWQLLGACPGCGPGGTGGCAGRLCGREGGDGDGCGPRRRERPTASMPRLLAAAALTMPRRDCWLASKRGPGGVTPMAVAEALGQQSVRRR